MAMSALLISVIWGNNNHCDWVGKEKWKTADPVFVRYIFNEVPKISNGQASFELTLLFHHGHAGDSTLLISLYAIRAAGRNCNTELADIRRYSNPGLSQLLSVIHELAMP